MQSNVLLANHALISVEIHDSIVLPAPPPPIPTVHFAFGILGFGFPATVHKTTGVLCHNQFVMQRGTDIGMGIPHFPVVPNILLPLLILSSGSKSEFGPLNILVENKPIASAFPMPMNLNLCCWGPTPPYMFPVPLGVVLPINTVVVDLNASSIWSCMGVMILDAAIQGGINALGSAFGKLFPSGNVANYVGNVIWMVIGDAVLGSPVGFSSSHYGFDNPTTGDRSAASAPYRTPFGGFLGDKENEWLAGRGGPTEAEYNNGESLEDYYGSHDNLVHI